MKVTLIVEMCADVPDEADLDGLCLNMNVDSIIVENFNDGEIKGARVTSYATMEVICDNLEVLP